LRISPDNIRLHGATLSEAPQNELGVVFLFARLQERFGVRIDKIRAGFPDCLARKIRSGTNKILRIEFEYKSANFKTHGHNPNGCDWIVCWEHNWCDVPIEFELLNCGANLVWGGISGSIPNVLIGMQVGISLESQSKTLFLNKRMLATCC